MTLLSPGIEIKEKDLSAYISRAATGRAGTVGKFQWGPCFDLTQVTDESDVVNTFGLPDDYTYASFLSCVNFLKYANDLRVVRICDRRKIIDGGTARNSSIEYQPGIDVVAGGKNYIAGDLIHWVYNEIECQILPGESEARIYFGHECSGNNGPAIEISTVNGASLLALLPLTQGTPTPIVNISVGPTELLETTPGIYYGKRYFTVACTQNNTANAVTGSVSIYWPADPIAAVATVGNGGVQEVTEIDFAGLTAVGLDGTYFTIDSPTVPYYVWFDLDGASIDPAPMGKTGIQVGIITGDSDSVIAGKAQVVLNAHAAFSATVNTTVVTATNAVAGATPDAADVDAGVNITVLTQALSGVIETLTLNMNGINLISTCNRVPEYVSAADTMTAECLANGTGTGSDAALDISSTMLSTIFFAKDSDSDEAILAHAPIMENLNLPTIYGRFPGAYGDDISVDIISHSDFEIYKYRKTMPIVLPETYLAPAQAEINRSVFGINGPQKEGQWGIIVYYKGEIVETFVGSTIPGDKDIYGRTIYISDLFAAGVSKYIMAACGDEGFWPDESMRVTLHGGLEGGALFTGTPSTPEEIYAVENCGGRLAGASVDDWQEGWDLFTDPDTLYVNLLFAGGACNESEADSVIIQKYISESVAEVRRDCLAFLSPSIATTTRVSAAQAVENAVAYRGSETLPGLNLNTSFSECDSGQHKFQFDKYNDKKRWVANNADIAGLCAFTDRVSAPWNSPAGLNRGIIKGIIKLAYDAKKSLRDTLYEAQLNPIVFFPSEGYCLFGDKTLQGKPSAFDRINVRRLFNLLEKAIGDASKYKLFENNTAFTRRSFVTQVSTYLDTIKAQGGVIEYYVWCDERNNTSAVIDRNEFVGTIFIKPPRSINYITLNFVATATGANFEELIASQF